MADARNCEECGALFEPLREHERFCSASCRIAWNGPVAGSRQSGEAALAWSVAAVADATRRLVGAGALDLAHSLALVSESVWWVTIVDATMVRYHREAYDRALAVLDPAERRAAEETFAGLRFVRNQMGYRSAPVSFIEPRPAPGGSGNAPVAAWTWKPVPAPPPGRVPPRSRAWVASRHRAYLAQVAGQPVGEVIARATAFLGQVHMIAGGEAGSAAQPAIGSAGA
ncbi:MAG: hypothetical protein ACRDP7_35025 [Trebonia sp.]